MTLTPPKRNSAVAMTIRREKIAIFFNMLNMILKNGMEKKE
jgi:hypothetical protein